MIRGVEDFLSRDPLEFKYSAISPYVFVGNNPINAIDPDGREIKYVIRDKNGNPTNVLTYRNSNFWYANGDRYNPGKESLDITLFKTLSVFRKIEKSGDNVLISQLKALEKSPKFHFIESAQKPGRGSAVYKYEPNKTSREESEMVKMGLPIGTQTVFDFSKEARDNFKYSEGVISTDFTTVVHEMQHQFDYDQGNAMDNQEENTSKDPMEIRAVNNENRARKIDGIEKRTTYGGKKIEPNKLK
jgi:hypothetical protein